MNENFFSKIWLTNEASPFKSFTAGKHGGKIKLHCPFPTLFKFQERSIRNWQPQTNHPRPRCGGKCTVHLGTTATQAWKGGSQALIWGEPEPRPPERLVLQKASSPRDLHNFRLPYTQGQASCPLIQRVYFKELFSQKHPPLCLLPGKKISHHFPHNRGRNADPL